MRNVFLGLLLANLLVAAWQSWVDPTPVPASVTAGTSLRSLAGGRRDPPDRAQPPRRGTGSDLDCLRVGPFRDGAALQRAQRFLAGQGISVRQISRETPLWLGHWVRIDGLASVDMAEEARRRLLAGGLTEAYVMQETAGHTISLGVFRDRERAQRVADAARAAGFSPELRDRYRPAAEEWLLVTTGRAASLGDLRLPGGRILRAEPAACNDTGSPAPKVRDVE